MILDAKEYAALGFECGEDESACEKALVRAQSVVDLLTGGKCSSESVDGRELAYLKQAVAAQAELYLTRGAQPLAGKTVLGDFSYTFDGDARESVSSVTMTILKLAGLYSCLAGSR